MRIGFLVGLAALALAGAAHGQEKPTLAAPFSNNCVPEAIPAAGICRVVGTATLANAGGPPLSWHLYEIVSGEGRKGLSIMLADGSKVVARMPVSARAVDAWARNPYVVASIVRQGESDYAAMWMRGQDIPADFALFRIDPAGPWTPVDVSNLWPAVSERLTAVTGPQCYSIDSDINWRTFGLRYDMVSDDGSCGVAFLELGVENGAVRITDALAVRDEAPTPKRRSSRRRR